MWMAAEGKHTVLSPIDQPTAAAPTPPLVPAESPKV